MVAETNTPSEVVTEAVKANNEAVAKTVTATAEKGKRAAKKTARKARGTAKRTAAKPQVRAQERNDDMIFEPKNVFAGFNAFPAAPAFDTFFAGAAERSEQVALRSRKAAEQLADLYRGNIEAFAEAGRIAANGAQSIGQSVMAKGRDSVEETASTVRSFAAAKSPTELLQLQSDFARNAFDRFVEDSANVAESMVKLAGEAFQPISNRASANVEKLNDITA